MLHDRHDRDVAQQYVWFLSLTWSNTKFSGRCVTGIYVTCMYIDANTTVLNVAKNIILLLCYKTFYSTSSPGVIITPSEFIIFLTCKCNTYALLNYFQCKTNLVFVWNNTLLLIFHIIFLVFVLFIALI